MKKHFGNDCKQKRREENKDVCHSFALVATDKFIVESPLKKKKKKLVLARMLDGKIFISKVKCDNYFKFVYLYGSLTCKFPFFLELLLTEEGIFHFFNVFI